MVRFVQLALAAAAILLADVPSQAAAEDFTPVLASAMQGAKVPAMGILVIRDGKVAGEAVRGVRRNDAPESVTPTDVWHIGSDGKVMTVALIGRLADRGVLSWTAPLETMLPDLAASMQPQYRRATLVHLLSHHSGLPHDLTDPKAMAELYTAPSPRPPSERRRAYVARALQEAPVGPITDANYSNTGFLVAALVAERATGKPFETLMREEVFAPLGMTHVGLGLTHPGQPMGHLDGKPAAAKDENPDFFAPAGNVYLPLDDWALFCLDQLRGAKGEGKLLKPATYALMQTAQPGGPTGLGWGVQDKVAGRKGPVLAHAGSDGTWYAVVALFPKTGGGVLVTANAGESMGGDVAARAAFKQVVDSLSPPAP